MGQEAMMVGQVTSDSTLRSVSQDERYIQVEWIATRKQGGAGPSANTGC